MSARPPAGADARRASNRQVTDRETPAYDVRVERDVPARMRDGTILRADVARPVPRAGAVEAFPVILSRTPYGKRPLESLARAGYVAVCQDVRGRYASDGPFEPVHQMCGASIDGQDGYDTTMWAAGRDNQRLLVGPWGHTAALTRRVGEVDFGPAAELDDQTLMLGWFDHWLKGRDSGALDTAPVRYFVMGLNQWRRAETWPPASARSEPWYLHSRGEANTAAGDGWLSRAAPSPDEAPSDAFRYDPRDPVPTIWPLDDQNVPLDHRPLDQRHDLLVYSTEPLAQPLEIAGDALLDLYAASSAVDTDYIARLCDVHGDGFVRPLCTGIVRARYRAGFDAPQLLQPGVVEHYRIRLAPTAHRFMPGHRLRLDVTSSDFPNYDRNHNSGAEDFSDPTLVVAQKSVYHHSDRASCLILPVTQGT